MPLKIGLIGIVGQELKQDPWGTLQTVAEIGYQGIEGGARVADLMDLSLPEAKQRLAELGLEVPAQGHVGLDSDDEDVDRTIETALGIGSPYVVQYWGPVESRGQLLREAEFLNHVGECCRKAEVGFCYHNHNHEFAAFDGKYALDILMENTDPEAVNVELDVAWVTYGGADPVELIHRYAGRCPVLHVKDIAQVPGNGEAGNAGRKGTQFTEVGTGVVDLEGTVQAARECGVEWLVIEQDRMRDLEPLESIRVSYENLKKVVG